jgi:DNA-binding transcriptional LysR family regulator
MDLLAQMATFVKVVDAGKLSTAARALRLSLAAVSRQLSALEEEVGGPLLLRTTRKLTVTEGGQRYYEHCLRVLREVDAAQRCVRAGHSVAGLLTVTAPVTFGLARLSSHLPSLLTAHPGLRIDLRLEDRITDLVAEGVDVAIRGGSALPDSSLLIARPLTSYPRVVVASPGYLRRRSEPKTPADLSRHDALIHLGGSGIADRWRFSKDGSESVIELRGALRTNAVYVLRDSAIAGLGVALLPDWLVADDVAAGRLKLLLRGFATPPTTVSAVHRTELRGAPRVKALIDHLVQAFEREAAARQSP